MKRTWSLLVSLGLSLAAASLGLASDKAPPKTGAAKWSLFSSGTKGASTAAKTRPAAKSKPASTAKKSLLSGLLSPLTGKK